MATSRAEQDTEDDVSILPAGRKARVGPDIGEAVQRHLPIAVPHWPPLRLSRQGVLLILLGIALGALVAANLQTKPKPAVTREEYPRQVMTDTIARLEAEQADLKRTITDLRRMITERQEQAAAAKTTLAGISKAIEAHRHAAGTTALKGQGIRLTLDDSAIKSIPAGDDPSFYIVHEYQLRDVVNALWAAGAEAIAINGERLVTTSSIYCVGSTILVNNTRLSAPYELTVIGNPQALEEAMNNPNILKSLKTRVKVYGLQFKLVKHREVAVPAFNGSMVTRYASPEVE
jgi:uncharacterized protein YlxW (UPF0749 family)